MGERVGGLGLPEGGSKDSAGRVDLDLKTLHKIRTSRDQKKGHRPYLTDPKAHLKGPARKVKVRNYP